MSRAPLSIAARIAAAHRLFGLKRAGLGTEGAIKFLHGPTNAYFRAPDTVGLVKDTADPH
jgi:hypothetical protein